MLFSLGNALDLGQNQCDIIRLPSQEIKPSLVRPQGKRRNVLPIPKPNKIPNKKELRVQRMIINILPELFAYLVNIRNRTVFLNITLQKICHLVLEKVVEHPFSYISKPKRFKGYPSVPRTMISFSLTSCLLSTAISGGSPSDPIW